MSAVAFAAALFVSAPAMAGPPSTTAVKETQPHDNGGSWFVGGALGFGGVSAEDLDEGVDSYGSVFGSLHFGGMVRPRLGLLAEAWGSGWLNADKSAGSTYDQAWQYNLGVGLQWWAFDDFWLKGVVAASLMNLEGDTRRGKLDGASILGAVGYEVWQGRRFAFDVQARVSLSSYGQDQQTTSTALQLGFTFF